MIERDCGQPPLQSGQTALTEPGEMPPYAGDAFETEWFDGFASNVRDRFLDRIGRVDQA
jgi:hypothetical protein